MLRTKKDKSESSEKKKTGIGGTISKRFSFRDFFCSRFCAKEGVAREGTGFLHVGVQSTGTSLCSGLEHFAGLENTVVHGSEVLSTCALSNLVESKEGEE